jgi:hypothetical protein
MEQIPSSVLQVTDLIKEFPVFNGIGFTDVSKRANICFPV